MLGKIGAKMLLARRADPGRTHGVQHRHMHLEQARGIDSQPNDQACAHQWCEDALWSGPIAEQAHHEPGDTGHLKENLGVSVERANFRGCDQTLKKARSR